jgi:hypothetical protein
MIDPESAKKYKFFLGMKHEKGQLGDDGIWHYKTAELQCSVVTVRRRLIFDLYEKLTAPSEIRWLCVSLMLRVYVTDGERATLNAARLLGGARVKYVFSAAAIGSLSLMDWSA